MGENRWPRLLLKAILQVQDVMRWKWPCTIQNTLQKCNMVNVYNIEPDNTWIKMFKIENKNIDAKEWYERAKLKSSLKDYIKYKGEPTLEHYLLDQNNFKGINLKFKARSNSLELEGSKSSWSQEYSGLCKICNNNMKETVDHFVFQCSRLHTIREDTFKELKNELYLTGVSDHLGMTLKMAQWNINITYS